jgi:hypothetical protein
MKRLIAGCLFLVLVQIGLVAATHLMNRTETAPSGAGLLLAFHAADIDEVLLEDGEGRHLALKKDKGRWLLPEAGSFPADTDRVQSLIDRLAAMERGWPEASTLEAAVRFKVAEDRYVRKLNLLKSGTAQAIVYLGTSPGLRKMYLRAENDPEIHTLALRQHELDVKTDRWIDTGILHLAPERIKRIELPGLLLEQGPDGLQPSDLKPGEEVIKQRRDSLVKRLAELTITSILGMKAEPEYGLAEPVFRCTVEFDNGAIVEYVFGQSPKTSKSAQPAEKDGAGLPPESAARSFVLKVSGQEQLFLVDGWPVDELHNATRSSLVRAKPAQPPTTVPFSDQGGQPATQTP